MTGETSALEARESIFLSPPWKGHLTNQKQARAATAAIHHQKGREKHTQDEEKQNREAMGPASVSQAEGSDGPTEAALRRRGGSRKSPGSAPCFPGCSDEPSISVTIGTVMLMRTQDGLVLVKLDTPPPSSPRKKALNRVT